ncbi:MAG: 3'(2'),5'-bisphosphate nucleotidase CysQ [Deltaproteobacteria bacterium]|nr:3'(2'),5'-bisphosphate nucleotidase CysQ [Deltaproteobacteria bacterium]
MTTLRQETEIAYGIALRAAELVRGYHGKKMAVDRKSENEPVTEADRLASALIVSALCDAFPDDSVLSEELPDDGSRLGQRRVWMVDPIDGTKDFIRGDLGYAVMIGLCIDGRPRIGIVAQPPTRITYAGFIDDNERVAWQQEADQPRVPLVPSKISETGQIRLAASKSHRGPEIDAVRAALGIKDELNIGGVGMKMSLVANGTCDLYVYPGDKTRLWDSCAPEAILTAAGGRVSDLAGNLLRYDEPELFNKRGIIASNGPLHPRVVEALAAAGVRA